MQIYFSISYLLFTLTIKLFMVGSTSFRMQLHKYIFPISIRFPFAKRVRVVCPEQLWVGTKYRIEYFKLKGFDGSNATEWGKRNAFLRSSLDRWKSNFSFLCIIWETSLLFDQKRIIIFWFLFCYVENAVMDFKGRYCIKGTWIRVIKNF